MDSQTKSDKAEIQKQQFQQQQQVQSQIETKKTVQFQNNSSSQSTLKNDKQQFSADFGQNNQGLSNISQSGAKQYSFSQTSQYYVSPLQRTITNVNCSPAHSHCCHSHANYSTTLIKRSAPFSTFSQSQNCQEHAQEFLSKISDLERLHQKEVNDLRYDYEQKIRRILLDRDQREEMLIDKSQQQQSTFVSVQQQDNNLYGCMKCLKKKKKIAGLKDTISKLSDEMTKLSDINKTAQEGQSCFSLCKKTLEDREAQLEQLKGQIDELLQIKQKFGCCCDQLNLMKTEQTSQNEQIGVLKNTIVGDQKTIDELRATIQENNSCIEFLKKQLADVTKAKDDAVGAQSAEATARDQDFRNSQLQITALNEKIEKLNLLISGLEGKVKKKKDKLNKFRKTFDSNIASIVQSKEVESVFIKEKSTKLETELQNALASVQGEQEANKNLVKLNDELNAKLQLLEKVRLELEQQLIADRQCKLTQQEVTTQRYVIQLQEKEQEIEKLSKEIVQMQNQNKCHIIETKPQIITQQAPPPTIINQQAPPQQTIIKEVMRTVPVTRYVEQQVCQQPIVNDNLHLHCQPYITNGYLSTPRLNDYNVHNYYAPNQ